MECFKIFRKPLNTSINFPRVSEFYRAFPNTSEDFRKFSKIFKNCRKIVSELSDIFRFFPKTSEDFRRLPTISEDFLKIHCWNSMLEGRFKHFATISEVFRTFPKTFKNFGNLLECCFLHCPVLFPKFSKEFTNIQQRRHEPLLPVTDRPLDFFMYVINK